VDYLKRYVHPEGHFQLFVVNTTRIGRDLFEKLVPSPDALQLLTQASTGALLLTAAGLKDEEGTLSISFQGMGPVTRLTAEANSRGHVRAILDRLDLITEQKVGLFADAIGSGTLIVNRQARRDHKPYRSMVPLVEGEMAYQLASFLLQSDQIRAGILLGTTLDAERGVAGAGGILIRALPGADPNLVVIFEDRLANLPPMGELFAGEDGHARIGEILLDGIDLDWLSTTEVTYRCNCNRAKIFRVLASLQGAYELMELPLSATRRRRALCRFQYR